MSDTRPLRPYQQVAIDRFMKHPNRRQMYGHVMGAGKTRTAIESAKAMAAKRVVVVAPALARPNWVKEWRKWADLEVASMTHKTASMTSLNKEGKPTLSGPQREAHARALAADIVVVSYNLVSQLPAREADLVIFDESHRLGRPLSAQSKFVRAYLKAFPKMAVLMLTGTPAPTEIQQLWHQMDLLQPGIFGKPRDTGDIPWSFLNTYCNKSEVELPNGETRYKFFGGKELSSFQKRVSHLIHRVTEEDLAAYLPPLRTSLLWLDQKTPFAKVAKDWTDELDDNVSHIALLAHHHKEVDRLAVAMEKEGWPVFKVSGHQTPEQRQLMLDDAAERPRACVVATADSVAEAVDLSFVRRALIFEFTSSPGRSAQLLRRFARPGSAYTHLPTTIEYVAFEEEAQKAETLHARLETVAQVMAQDKASAELQQLFVAREMSAERLDNLFISMFSETRMSLQEESTDE